MSRIYTYEKTVKGLPELGDKGLGATEENVRLCVEWVREFMTERTQVNRTKTKRKTSYFYKHRVEEHVGKYIANRDFIVALHLCGYKLKPDGKEAINFFSNAIVKKEHRHLFYAEDKQRYERKKKAQEHKDMAAKYQAAYKQRVQERALGASS